MILTPEFYTDKDVARLLSMSPSWVRVQRLKRRRNLPHTLNLDPRMIGTCPRYVRGEVEALVAQIVGAQAAKQ
jgi:hypothetical protein